ncbi:hypothetical protein HYX14_00375 [Candidatus Woesearchaeota archaeon]|nr:hypothetical protein [Candidatus Woesearchaeota archaeon]
MEEELIKNIKIFLRSAELVYQTNDYTSAVILYFKTLFVALDLFLLKKIQIVPKDHSERFRLLEKSFPKEYSMLDKYFSIYRSTYSTTIEKETCEEIRKYVIYFIKEKFGI